MSTVSEREALRRALQLAADSIEPRADGLQRIQARLRPPRPLALVWAEGAVAYLRMRGPAVLQTLLELLRGAASLVLQTLLELLRSMASLAWERFGPSSRASAGRASRTLGWLRPAAALGVTVFIVAAGTYIAIATQQGISPSASNALRSTGGGSGTGNGSQGNGGGTNAQGNSSLGSRNSVGPTASPTCTPAKPSGAKPSGSPTGLIQSTSPSASPTDSSGGSPSPTVGDSSTPTPGASTPGLANLSTDSPAVATLTSRSILAHSSVTTSGLPRCGKKVTHNSPGPTPSAGQAVFSFGKLDDGS